MLDGYAYMNYKLVVPEILKGLRNKDNVQDLLERIEITPLDLEDLISSMLDNIDPFYDRKSALIFIVFLTANVHGYLEPFLRSLLQ